MDICKDMNIDFLIVCHEKDFHTLDICIKQIKKNISKLNNIFIVSNKNPSIDGIIYISEERYYSYVNVEKIKEFYIKNNSNFLYRSGWIYQQLLKLLSTKCIPELTDCYVVVDSDTLFLKDIKFSEDKFYYCVADEYHLPYLKTIKKLLGVEETIGFSTISHHMLFHKRFLNEMIENIEKRFEMSIFDCILSSIDYNELSSISEWDLYANYMIINHPQICEQRQLKWEDLSYIPEKNQINYMRETHDFISCHSWLR